MLDIIGFWSSIFMMLVTPLTLSACDKWSGWKKFFLLISFILLGYIAINLDANLYSHNLEQIECDSQNNKEERDFALFFGWIYPSAFILFLYAISHICYKCTKQ
nr:hypothetical protein 1 [bacterium]